MTDTPPPPVGTPAWFETAFGPYYADIYQHRDEEEADGVVAMLLERLPRAGAGTGPVLDIGCGTGRHLAALGRRGTSAFGLDLSPHLLALAARRAPGRVVRGDMRRLPFADGAFDAALSMFTSFGYFAESAENRRVLEEARRVVRPGGGLVIDYFNAERTLADLTPESARFVGRYDVVERRSLIGGPGGERIVKVIEIREGERLVDTLREEVTVYRPEELDALCRATGWTTIDRLGDYDGGRFDPAESSRLLLVARRDA
jgi:SAM-dependent methyltransferase